MTMANFFFFRNPMIHQVLHLRRRMAFRLDLYSNENKNFYFWKRKILLWKNIFFFFYLQLLAQFYKYFHPCVVILFISLREKKKWNSQVKGQHKREKKKEKGGRLTLSALANANFLFPARLQWDTLHACFCFDNLTTLSLSFSLFSSFFFAWL